MANNIDPRKRAELARSLAKQVADFPKGGLISGNGPTQALYILEFTKLAQRFLAAARHLTPKIDDVVSGLSLEPTSGSQAYSLCERLQPLTDEILCLDLDKYVEKESRRCDEFRSQLANITNEEARGFVEEAIECFESDLYRAAVVMSWIAAVRVLYDRVHTLHLNEFNDEATRVDSRWKRAKTPDDLARMKESEFLDRISAISIIGKNVKQELQKCLELRNGCGHPNSLNIGRNTVAHHIEILLMNVLTQCSKRGG
jgi:hypothetical protein